MEENINFQSETMDTTPSPDFNDTDTVSENSSTTLNTTEEPLVTVKYNHSLKNYSLKQAAEIIQKNMHFDSSIKKLSKKHSLLFSIFIIKHLVEFDYFICNTLLASFNVSLPNLNI